MGTSLLTCAWRGRCRLASLLKVGGQTGAWGGVVSSMQLSQAGGAGRCLGRGQEANSYIIKCQGREALILLISPCPYPLHCRLTTADEGPCWLPSEIYNNSIILSHWGR